MAIKLAFEKSDLITPTILNLCHNVNQLGLLGKKAENTIDLSALNWVRPLAILPIASLLFDLDRKDYNFELAKPANSDAGSYLKTIKFFEGVHSSDYFKRHKNYIPIVSLPNKLTEVKNRNQVLSCLLDILLEQIACKRNLYNAMWYALSEMFDNIWEHSKTEYGWFLAQYYRNKGFADICFLDNGITIKGSYDNKGIKVSNDAKAIELALSGKSTKKEDRGFGLWTTKRLVTESSLKGEFLVLSGQSGYYKSRSKEALFNLSCYWQGTIVLLRVNKTKETVDYRRYVE